MNSPITVYKLTILYLLDRITGAVSNSSISEFLLDRNVTNNYISVQQALYEMEKSGLVSSSQEGPHVMIRITREGRETLNYFGSDLNAGIKEECRKFLSESGLTLRPAPVTAAKYEKRPDGGYEVRLSAADDGIPVTEIRLSVPNEEIARNMCSRWPEKNEEIYQDLIDSLSQ